MTVLSIEPYYGRKSRLRVCLDGGADLVLYKGEIGDYGISEGAELSDELYEQIIREILIPRARKRALHLLEKQDRTVQNLSDKLSEAGYPEVVVEDALSYVESFHYTDDSRFAANYVRFHKDGKSKRRIVSDLSAKGVDQDIIDAALEGEYTVSEEDMVRDILRKRGYDPSTADEKERAKHYRYLAGKGFSYDTIRNAMAATP